MSVTKPEISGVCTSFRVVQKMARVFAGVPSVPGKMSLSQRHRPQMWVIFFELFAACAGEELIRLLVAWLSGFDLCVVKIGGWEARAVQMQRETTSHESVNVYVSGLSSFLVDFLFCRVVKNQGRIMVEWREKHTGEGM